MGNRILYIAEINGDTRFQNVTLEILEDSNCKNKPPKYPVKFGSCDYYKWRFENFLERHKDCCHLPPKYYFGPMKKNSDTPYVGKQIDAVNDWWSGVINTEPLKPPYPKYDKGTPITRESYGFKYCTVFSNSLMPRLSLKGKVWLTKAREYLQKYMDNGLMSETFVSKYNEKFNKKVKAKTLKDVELDENWFQEFAFATHPDAYLDAGLIELSIKDKFEVTMTPDFKEWVGAATWEQAWIVGKEQLKKWKKDAKSKYDDVEQYLEKYAKKGEEKAKELLKIMYTW